MAFTYRDVPDDAAETFNKRAAEPGQVASRPTNAEIVDRLRVVDRTSGPGREEILAEIAANRR
jgi:hypothetical protein